MGHDDLDQVAAIETEAYPYPWSRQIFRDCLKVGYCCQVIEWNRQLNGYAIASVAVGEAHLLNLCIAPSCRRAGLASTLLEAMLQASRRLGAIRIFLEVRPSNQPAIGLYRKFGFVEVGDRPRYYPAPWGREDALIMARELGLDAPMI